MSRFPGARQAGWLIAALLSTYPLPALASNEYQIDLSVDPDRGILHGQEKVTYRNETEAPLNTLFLEAPGEPGTEPASGNERWRITACLDAKGNPVNLAWKPEEEAYAVTLDPPLGAGFKTTFTLDYERPISPGDRAPGYLDFNDRGPQAWFLKFRAYRAGSFGSDDFKDVSVALAPPSGWTLAGTGSPASARGGASAGKTTLVAKGVRNFALALGQGFAAIPGTAGAVPVQVLHPPGQEAWARAALGEMVEAINYYAAFLGAYPPPAVSVLPAGPGAIDGESSSQVAYLPAGLEGADLRESAALQAARLVWGWSVGDPSDTTPFVANGLAIWCQQNYLAKRNNTDLHAQYLASGINDTYLAGVAKGYDTTLLRSSAERKAMDWDFERIVARAKSAAVMHMLGGILGVEKLQEVVRGILATSRGKVFTDRDFQKAAQAATTSRLDGFFDQFLRSKDYLDYYLSHVRTNPAAGGFEVRADVFKTGTAAMPVEVVVEDATGTRVRSIFPADRASGEMAIPIKAPLASITLDPLNLLPLVSRVGSRGHLDLAEMQIAEGRLLRADEQVDQALSDAPGDPRAWLLKGRILKERGDWAAGIKMWERAVSLAASPADPSRLWAQIWIARVYDLQGKRSEATALYSQVAAAADRRGSRKAAEAGVAVPYADSWPPRLP